MTEIQTYKGAKGGGRKLGGEEVPPARGEKKNNFCQENWEVTKRGGKKGRDILPPWATREEGQLCLVFRLGKKEKSYWKGKRGEPPSKENGSARKCKEKKDDPGEGRRGGCAPLLGSGCQRTHLHRCAIRMHGEGLKRDQGEERLSARLEWKRHSHICLSLAGNEWGGKTPKEQRKKGTPRGRREGT